MATRETIQAMLDAIDEAFDRKSWHGTNLRGSLRSVTVEEASWRPEAGRHNIWEVVVHAAYWKYIIRRSVTNEPRGSFALKGHDWFPREGSGQNAWRTDVALLGEEHGKLRAAVAGLKPNMLNRIARKKYTIAQLVRGAAAHDLYHAGQIQLLKRLQKSLPSAPEPGRTERISTISLPRASD